MLPQFSSAVNVTPWISTSVSAALGPGHSHTRVVPRPGSSTRRVSGVAASQGTCRTTATLQRCKSARADDRRPSPLLHSLRAEGRISAKVPAPASAHRPVDTPMQRRLRVRDSFDLAWHEWQGIAGWDRLTGEHCEDEWAIQWGRAYVEFAAGEKRRWLQEQGVKFTPVVGWAERGDGRAGGHGNSVPRFHVAWGTGTGICEPFADKARAAASGGQVRFYFRHQVDGLIIEHNTVEGVRGTVLAPDTARRGAPSNRQKAGEFELTAQAVIIATGGIGGNHARCARTGRRGSAPRRRR